MAGLTVALFALSALSFIRFAVAAAFYSAWYGVPRLAAELTEVNRRGDIFFLASLALLLLAARCVASFIRVSAISSVRLRLVTRYVVALALSIFATGMFIWLFDLLGVGAVPGAFSK
jgi:hypothetical protein